METTENLKVKTNEESIEWINLLRSAIIGKSVEDYYKQNRLLNKRTKKLRKIRSTTKNLKEERLVKSRMKRTQKEIRNILQFYNSQWYIFLTDISREGIIRKMRKYYINNWHFSKKSYGYLCLCKFRKKEI